MKRIKLNPESFDGAKFAKKYRLKEGEYYMRREDDGFVYLYFPDRLPDRPVTEAPDAPPEWPEKERDGVLKGKVT